MLTDSLIRRDWILLLGGVFLLFCVPRDLTTGTSLLFRKTVNRSEDRFLFWSSIWMEGIIGLGCLVAFFLRLAHR
jgi:hypothetical protein